MVWLVEFSMIWYVMSRQNLIVEKWMQGLDGVVILVKTRADHSSFFRPSFKSISNIEIFAECNDAWKNGLIATNQSVRHRGMLFSSCCVQKC